MSYAKAKAVDPSSIPVIDITDLRSGEARALPRVAGELVAAAETAGFFYVSGHGIARALIDDVFELSRAFFALPDGRKDEVSVSSQHRGFLRVGSAKMYESARPDLKESFVWGLDVAADDPDCIAGRAMIGPNRWPSALPAMRAAYMRYFDECNALGRDLLRAFAVSLGVDRDYFVREFTRPVTRLTAVYYPPQPPDAGVEQFGVAPHTDFGTLTFVCQDSVGGLQVRGRNREWLEATPIEGTLVVNVGDLLARWTNDRFRSTPHRVVNASGRARYSVAAFVDPDFDCVVDPIVRPGETAKYEATTAGRYIVGRFDKSFSYRKKRTDTPDGTW
jgi:isopenicillin N synthase-like dioxygenase